MVPRTLWSNCTVVGFSVKFLHNIRFETDCALKTRQIFSLFLSYTGSFLYAAHNKLFFCFVLSRQFYKKVYETVLRIRIRDPGSGAFLPPGSGIRDGAMVGSGSGITKQNLLIACVKKEVRSGIRDPVLFYPPDPGSEIRIRDGAMVGSGIRDKTSRIRNTGMRLRQEHYQTVPVPVLGIPLPVLYAFVRWATKKDKI
jgi:hypothetical protein